jgi:predicted O-methyltransferase YrrM
LVEGNFDAVLDEILKYYPQLDLAFIDGNHKKEATLMYFQQMLPLAHNNSVFIFDDIYWSKGMTEAWNEIKKHPQVTVTVDLFFVGLVFFRKEQAKQDFKLRVL